MSDKKVRTTNTELVDKCIEYIAETQGRMFLLEKGYKPALEELVTELGFAEEHHGNRIYVTLPKL